MDSSGLYSSARGHIQHAGSGRAREPLKLWLGLGEGLVNVGWVGLGWAVGKLV